MAYSIVTHSVDLGNIKCYQTQFRGDRHQQVSRIYRQEPKCLTKSTLANKTDLKDQLIHYRKCILPCTSLHDKISNT